VLSFLYQSTYRRLVSINRRLTLPEYANLPRGLLEDGNQSPVVVAADAERTAVLTLFFRGCAPFPIDEDTCKVRIFNS